MIELSNPEKLGENEKISKKLTQIILDQKQGKRRTGGKSVDQQSSYIHKNRFNMSSAAIDIKRLGILSSKGTGLSKKTTRKTTNKEKQL